VGRWPACGVRVGGRSGSVTRGAAALRLRGAAGLADRGASGEGRVRPFRTSPPGAVGWRLRLRASARAAEDAEAGGGFAE
jgi:hypothetical protein